MHEDSCSLLLLIEQFSRKRTTAKGNKTHTHIYENIKNIQQREQATCSGIQLYIRLYKGGPLHLLAGINGSTVASFSGTGQARKRVPQKKQQPLH